MRRCARHPRPTAAPYIRSRTPQCCADGPGLSLHRPHTAIAALNPGTACVSINAPFSARRQSQFRALRRNTSGHIRGPCPRPCHTRSSGSSASLHQGTSCARARAIPGLTRAGTTFARGVVTLHSDVGAAGHKAAAHRAAGPHQDALPEGHPAGGEEQPKDPLADEPAVQKPARDRADDLQGPRMSIFPARGVIARRAHVSFHMGCSAAVQDALPEPPPDTRPEELRLKV